VVKIRVVYVLGSSWGGIPHYTAELANAVSRYANVAVIKPKDSNDYLFDQKVGVVDVFPPIEFSQKNFLRLLFRNIKKVFLYRNVRLVDTLKPDIIHIPASYPYISLFAFLYRLNKRYPMVCTIHGTYKSILHLLRFEFKYGGLNHAVSLLISEFLNYLPKYDKVIVHAQSNMDTLVMKGYDPKKIAVIPHGAYNLFKKIGSNKRSDEEDNSVLFFGYITEKKGIKYLFKALPIVVRKIHDVKIIIAGEGDLSRYSGLISKYRANLEIYNEFIPNEVVSKLFSRAKLVILPYEAKDLPPGHSGVLTIAFSFGKPVVTTNGGEFPTLVKDCGLAVPPENPEALAEAIIKLLEDDELRKRMSRNALKRAEELSWDNIAKMHIKVYEDVLNERGKRDQN